MSTPSPTVVQREAGWLTAQTGVTTVCGPVQPYVRRPTGREDRRAMLRRTGMNVMSLDFGHDQIDHSLLLILDWPSGENLIGASTYLEAAAELLVTLLRGPDRSHGGLWASSADRAEDGSPDITATWTDPDDPVAAADDGRLTALIAYTVTEIVPRGV